MVQWSEDELFDMVEEMQKFWDDDNFWDEVMDGYMDKMDGADDKNKNLSNKYAKKQMKNKFEKHTAVQKKGKTESDMDFKNFKKTKGKCRFANGNYNAKHVYQGGGRKDKFQKNVKNQE